ncbi:MAG: glutamate--tRNA ligase [Deltaproteobacteria bacterium]|uniref:Glutamate--tRNA ligase n=1 Tax=Candidatus Zymogenus saltonus TaxID=2844893 RepID=A0A9D8PKP3_9DELT|nr:glutamate--tRNA ligase [Candidatus Zymogenus saltonus]
MTSTRTRFAPAPTGYLHIGGARTALFNWLYARHTNGKFILRIEDTDRERSKDEYRDAILRSMEWLGLDWDEGPFYQSERDDRYREGIEKLLETGNAYRCYCTVEELERKREEALKRGEKPKYDGTCRDKEFPERNEPHVIRFKTPLTDVTEFNDLIKGKISFDNGELDDLIIRRTNGTPTYNLTVVIDDADMGMTHVIRGDDHVNNTPRQIVMFEALGLTIPKYAHVPMIFGSDQKKLSKRHGALSVTEYRDAGYLAEAVVNYLVRLGWSHGDQEIFSRDELIEKFDIANVGKSAGIFNFEKMEWLNSHYIKTADPKKLAGELTPFIEKTGYKIDDITWLASAVETLQERAKTLVEMAAMSEFYLNDNIEYEETAAKKFLTVEVVEPFRLLTGRLDSLVDWNTDNIEGVFTKLLEETGLKLGKVAQPVRVALTGGTVSPGIYEIIYVIGKERVVKRINRAVDYIEGQYGEGR